VDQPPTDLVEYRRPAFAIVSVTCDDVYEPLFEHCLRHISGPISEVAEHGVSSYLYAASELNQALELFELATEKPVSFRMSDDRQKSGL